jgi:hypothetical protein
MEGYQGIVMAECVVRERRVRAEQAAERWHLGGQGGQGATLRESVAGALIGLARWLAPGHAALTTQPR